MVKKENELVKLANVGPAVLKDLKILGVSTIAQLAKKSPDDLYEQLQFKTGQPHDPCMWDVFAAIVHEAKTGQKRPWHDFSKIRKGV